MLASSCHSTSMWSSIHPTSIYTTWKVIFISFSVQLLCNHGAFTGRVNTECCDFARSLFYLFQQCPASFSSTSRSSRGGFYHHVFALNCCHYTSNSRNCVSNWPLLSERDPQSLQKFRRPFMAAWQPPNYKAREHVLFSFSD